MTPLTREHSKEVSDLFSPAKAAERTAAEANAQLSSATGAASVLKPVPGVYALGDCCANQGRQRIIGQSAQWPPHAEDYLIFVLSDCRWHETSRKEFLTPNLQLQSRRLSCQLFDVTLRECRPQPHSKRFHMCNSVFLVRALAQPALFLHVEHPTTWC